MSRAGVGVLCAVLLVASRVGAEPCAPWPGEPDPLPRVTDADSLRARWAQLRAQELGVRAQALERWNPAEAFRLWHRVRCLDLRSRDAAQGIERMRPVRVHRPSVVAVQRTPQVEAVDAWRGLGKPIAVRVARRAPTLTAPRVGAEQARLARIEALIHEIEGQVRGARFQEALAGATEVRAELSRLEARGPRQNWEVRLEVLLATAQLALGDGDGARQRLSRALELDPELELDPMATPPKLRRALAAARAAR